MKEDHLTKPIVVSNWTKFLSQKLFAFYKAKKECDLTLRFDDGTILIAHSLVLHLSTDFFKIALERQSIEGNAKQPLLMPQGLLRKPVNTLVDFMYTGRLDFSEECLDSLLIAAKLMGMSIAVRLLEKQQNMKTAAKAKTPSGNEVVAACGGGNNLTDPGLGASYSQMILPKTSGSHSQTLGKRKEQEDEPRDPPLKQPRKNYLSEQKKNPRSVPSNRYCEPTKQLTVSEVYLKYMDMSEGRAPGDSTTKAIAASLCNHPLIVRGKGEPVKARVLEKNNLGHRRYIAVTVRSHLNKTTGKRTMQIIRSPEEATHPEGPWECGQCKEEDGSTSLVFDSFYACRCHHNSVHGQKFDPRSCDRCGLKLNRKQALAYHRLVRHGIDPPEECVFANCEACNFVAIDREALEKHVMKKHCCSDLPGGTKRGRESLSHLSRLKTVRGYGLKSKKRTDPESQAANQKKKQASTKSLQNYRIDEEVDFGGDYVESLELPGPWIPPLPSMPMLSDKPEATTDSLPTFFSTFSVGGRVSPETTHRVLSVAVPEDFDRETQCESQPALYLLAGVAEHQSTSRDVP